MKILYTRNCYIAKLLDCDVWEDYSSCIKKGSVTPLEGGGGFTAGDGEFSDIDAGKLFDKT